MPVALFPDTNVVLHFRPFEEIDWCALANASDVTIVATATLVREVDEKKNSSRGHIQKRARRFASWLGALPDTAAGPVRDHVTIEIRIEEPELALDFAQRGLVPTIADDRIVAAMLVYAQANPATRCICVSDDTILVRKARAAGFAAVAPAEKDRLQDEADERDVELRKLREVNATLQKQVDARPRFELTFGTLEATRLLLRFGRLRDTDDEELEELLKVERSMFGTLARFGIGFEPPAAHKVDAYISAVRSWAPAHIEAERSRMLTTRIDELTLHNVGGGNGDDIEITLTFPEHVYVAERRDIARQPKPRAPEGRDRFALSSDLLDRASMNEDRVAHLVDQALARSETSVTEVNAHELHISVRDLKHTDSRVLDAFELWFASPDDITAGATVDFKIHASTPPVVTGTLHLMFEVAEWGVALDESRLYRQR